MSCFWDVFFFSGIFHWDRNKNRYIHFASKNWMTTKMKNPLIRPDRAAVFVGEDDKLLVQRASREEKVEEKREAVVYRKVPELLRRRKGPPVWRDPSVTLEQDVSGTSRERSEVSILGKNQMVKFFRTLSISCLKYAT